MQSEDLADASRGRNLVCGALRAMNQPRHLAAAPDDWRDACGSTGWSNELLALLARPIPTARPGDDDQVIVRGGIGRVLDSVSRIRSCPMWIVYSGTLSGGSRYG